MAEIMTRTKATVLFGYWTVTATVVALVFVVTPSASASSGTLVVTSNTNLTEDHHGNILINGSNVTLDCDGHVVSGPGEPGFNGGIEIAGNLMGVVVRRCAVTGFAVNGIFGGGGASDCRYEANTLYGNGNHGMHLDFGSGYIVLDNTSRSNGAIGIVLTGATQSWIVHNTVQENRNWAGIALSAGSHENVVLNNTALRNSSGFILDNAVSNELRLNTASLNDSYGFLLIRGGNNNVLESNTANQNLIGLEITDGSTSNAIRSNTANRNSSEGFKVFMSDGNTFTSNSANENGGVGFLVFGGSSFTTVNGNVGHGNGSLDALDDGSGTGNVWTGNDFGKTSGF
jgi:parallel beta-helix repeat protein